MSLFELIFVGVNVVEIFVNVFGIWSDVMFVKFFN